MVQKAELKKARFARDSSEGEVIVALARFSERQLFVVFGIGVATNNFQKRFKLGEVVSWQRWSCRSVFEREGRHAYKRIEPRLSAAVADVERRHGRFGDVRHLAETLFAENSRAMEQMLTDLEFASMQPLDLAPAILISERNYPSRHAR